MTSIFIAGDSTAAKKEASVRPETGWGEKIGLFFDQNVLIKNKAKNGRSSKSFIEEGRLAEIEKEIQPGDYLFIQFGHNDQKIQEDRGTKPFGDYLAFLTQYIEVAQKQQACPVLLTSISRRDYLVDGKLNNETLGQYPEAMRMLASKLDVPCLDLFKITQEWLADFEIEETKEFFLHSQSNRLPNYPNGVIDNTHLSDLGAYCVASLVAQTIEKSPLSLKQQLIK